MATFNMDRSAADAIQVLFNGPALAGVGATTDPGLTPDKYHVLPWDPKEKSQINILENNGTVEYQYPITAASATVSLASALKTSIYNVDSIFGWNDRSGAVNALSDSEKAILRRDVVAILFVMTSYGYYDSECRESSAAEATAIRNIPVSREAASEFLNVDAINRAATFILARMHTKYQTNHVLGGNVMQASMASAVRAFYGVNPASARSDTATAKVKFYADCLHWALHPANERLLIPAVISNSRILTAVVHANGPKVTVIGKEEYFAIRANTPPASTHHFYVAAAAVQHLNPLGILEYMPNVSDMSVIKDGFTLIATHGASLHPAARHWGLTKITSNQKVVEPLCANLGYAVRKLMSGSSLAASPILMKEDSLDGGWKQFIDALRAAMDERGKEMLDSGVMDDIKKRIMPTARTSPEIQDVVRLMITGRDPTFRDPAGSDSGSAAGQGQS